jgi:hemerythrin-like domain-containing protein
MKITEALLAEHVVFHNLFDHIEGALPHLRALAEVRALAQLLQAVLESHSKVEDELIIEPLEHCFAQLGQQETFHEEHEEIDASLKEAVQARNLKTARQLLQAAVVASRHHFDKEERIIFPMAEKVLKGKTLTALGQAWMEQRKAIVA